MQRCDALIIGGGFYGLYLAEMLAARGSKVLLCERGPEPMLRASYSNQARVHNGYHYPRSVLTALRSRVNFPRFADEFAPAIRSGFEKIYAIPRQGSKVTAEQFAESMKRIGAPIQVAADNLKKFLFDRALVEDVFRVRESAFDSTELRRLMVNRAMDAGVEIRMNETVERLRALPRGAIRVSTSSEDLTAGMVVNCSYSQTNALAECSGLPVIALKHEIAEMALVQVPPELRSLGITVMDGPFFSCMPFPPRGLHTLSHVRYTPHGHWNETDAGRSPYEVFEGFEKRSAFAHMIRDAARYLPCLSKCEHRDSLWEVKTVLPRSEADDSRPILFRPHHGIPNYHVVMGGKIDNVYDVADELLKVIQRESLPLAAYAHMNKVDTFVSVVAVLRSYARFLPAFVDDVHRILDEHYSNYELVLVDNGSRDETPNLVRKMLQSECIRYLRLSRRMSAEMAAMAGLDATIGDYVVTLHPEFDPVTELPAMVEECRAGTDVVFGLAPFPKPPGRLYRSLRWGFYRFAKTTLGIEPVRGNSVYRCMSRAAVNALTRVRRRKRFFGQLATEIGLSVAVHEYEFISRSGKQPRVNLRRAARTAASMAMNHSAAPMRLVSLLGLAGSFMSLVYSLYVVSIYFLKDDVMPGWTTLSLQMSGLFFLTFIMLTLIGEHLGRLIDESVDRPLYHVREEQSSSVMLSDLTRKNVMDRSE